MESGLAKDGVGLEIVCNLGDECRKVLDDLRADILALDSEKLRARFLKTRKHFKHLS